MSPGGQRESEGVRGSPGVSGEGEPGGEGESGGGFQGCQGTEGGGPSKLASGYGGPRAEQILTFTPSKQFQSWKFSLFISYTFKYIPANKISITYVFCSKEGLKL